MALVHAHRGAPAERPENTLPSFERAVELGADGLETDLHRTADGRLVRRTTDVAAGEVLRTSLVDGTILSRVEPGTGGDPAPRPERGGKPAPRETPARRPGQRTERPSSPGSASFDLFGESK